MTTIAFKDGVLAADSLVTSGGQRDGFSQKIWRHRRVLIGGAGCTAICHRFCEWVRGGMRGKCPVEGSNNANGFVITPDGTMVVWGSQGPWVNTTGVVAFGSGGDLAMGAMLAGASAVEAVAAAIKLDIHSGGPIRSLTL
ncbi:hypothetical protein MARCHEWKA_00760 [Brevundimonas phage vB_BpoS-Marchewka]|uniref:Uncharacterized protein n=1 Tax=Brevundimonas phage vB_BpoS-Marchewka TaxID=2948604 RepID=A0A9E7N590_9CAUD|nr:hypothetical protein MARCHEWKA_00760 [Brevundimonas phage vB_BpoS-Marchewka]UTC29582.1 hypothetical protein BAMBUS_05240 [Brevundimonas phage vB_BpoS-Bambus]